MARNIAISAGIAVTFGTLLGLATAVLANDPNVIDLPATKEAVLVDRRRDLRSERRPISR